jgi:hypothetical protein
MIIRISRTTTMTCIPLHNAGCASPSIALQDIWIIMHRMGPGVLVNEPGVWDEGCGKFSLIPCGYLSRRRRVVAEHVIKYCAFKRDAAGNVCFAWDQKLLGALPGRWRGDLFVCGRPVGCLDFQLGDRIITGAAVDHQADCCPTTCP